MSLERWAENGWLKVHQTSMQEIRELFEGAIEDLQNAIKDLSAGWKFAIAYNAALRLCSILFYSLCQGIERFETRSITGPSLYYQS